MTPSPFDREVPRGARAPRLWFVSFEHRHQPLLPMRAFLQRAALGFLAGALLIAVSLLVGVIGYHAIAGLGWVDSILNASMILTGMGPVSPMNSNAAKLFASAYALFSGVAFLTSVGVLLSPMIHRFLHKFHLEFLDGDEEE